MDRTYRYVYIVDATFWFDGDNDPLKNVVDLSSFKLVGDDYYCNFSFEANSLTELTLCSKATVCFPLVVVNALICNCRSLSIRNL